MNFSQFIFTRIVATALALICAGVRPAHAASPRETVSLDGKWEFQLDPSNLGEADHWYLNTERFSGAIKVPGSWDAQGFGPETDKMRHNFIGKGWYRRKVMISSRSEGQRLFLCFGGVYRSARVWVNGKEVGRHLGYVSDFEFDITNQVQPGKYAWIVIEIDSEQHAEVDPLQGAMDIVDEIFSYWGGIWGHIRLEWRSSAWLEDLHVETQAAPSNCVVTANLKGKRGAADGLRLEILAPDGKKVAEREMPINEAVKDGQVELKVDVPDALLWSPESPNLYTAILTLLKQKDSLDRVESKFGIRTIRVQGSNFILNGKKYFLNGYGDDCVYPQTICPPSDKQFYIAQLKIAKSYGFNYVRLHSHFLPPEFFEACDEAGMFVSPELPIAYLRNYNYAQGKAKELYKSEWAKAIVRYRNHPSIFDWCMGNELWDGIDLAPDLYKMAKQLDPARLVIDSDGIMPSGFIDGQKDRPTLDFYTVMFNILTMPLANPAKFETGIPLKPIITHEEGNFAQFPQLKDIELYTDDLKPFWLTDTRVRIAKYGLLKETEKWTENSQKLYYLCNKDNIEALRKNPRISGYDWWLLQPWYPGSNGLLDVYRRPTSITPEQVRQFNGPVVLLEDGLKLNYRGNENLHIQFSVSNYSSKTLQAANLSWQILSGAQVLGKGQRTVDDVAQGGVSKLGEMGAALPNPLAPEPLQLIVRLEGNGQTYENQWTTWLYPAVRPNLSQPHPLYVSDDLQPMLAVFHPRLIPAQGNLPSPAVYVAREPTERLLEAAEEGSCVVLLSPAGVFLTDVTTFKSAWWLGVFPGDSNAGTMVYDSPVTKAIAPDGWCDAGWFHLLQGAQTVILDDLPAQPQVLIRALNVNSTPSPFSRAVNFDYRWRNKSLLFETKVGQGSWIVSGLNFDAALRHGGPEGAWLLTQLLAHAETLPFPTAAIPIQTLRSAVESSPFTQGPLIDGFSRLLRHNGKTLRGITYRESNGVLLRIDQQRPLNELTWETASAPAGERTTFVFAGGGAFVESPCGSRGFSLYINHAKVLDFDTTREPAEWESPDGKSVLRYVPMLSQSSWGETMGLFYLSVPGSDLVGGKPAEIEVHAIGQDETHWFAISPYPDILNGAAVAANVH